MNLLNLLRIAFKALHRNKLRALLTMLGIIIGVASVIAMLAIGQGSKISIQQQISSMGSNMILIRPGSMAMGGVQLGSANIQLLTINDVDALQQGSSYLSAITPVAESRGQAINGNYNWPTTIMGVSPEYLQIRKYTLKDGVMFTERDVKTFAKVCVVGQTVVNNLFPNGEDPVGKNIRFKNIPFKIIGVLDKKGENTFGQDQDDLILTPYTTVQKRILATTYFQNIFASTRNADDAEPAINEITQIMRQSHHIKAGDPDDFQVRAQQELISTFSSTSELLTILLAAISGISLLVGGIGIMNIMYVSVTERTREIGLRMAIGGRGIDILLQFLTEAIMISLTGGLIGIGLGIGSSYVLTATLGWPILITSYSIVLSFVVCAVTGIFFGWYPAKSAAKLDPIDALRYE